MVGIRAHRYQLGHLSGNRASLAMRYRCCITFDLHEILLEREVSFADLHLQGIDAVVARIEIAFKVPLKSKDEFVC
jgi:hypothetical protein